MVGRKEGGREGGSVGGVEKKTCICFCLFIL